MIRRIRQGYWQDIMKNEVRHRIKQALLARGLRKRRLVMLREKDECISPANRNLWSCVRYTDIKIMKINMT